MKPYYKKKVQIFLYLINKGVNKDDAAFAVGYKNFDSMRGSLCCEGGCEMKQTLEKREPVEWTRKKKYPNTQKLKIVNDETIKRISELEQENKKLQELVHVLITFIDGIRINVNDAYMYLNDVYSADMGGHADECKISTTDGK